MISFDLICAHQHVFEIWFRSSGDYDDQRTRGLIACPVCGDTGVAKAVMAPNIGAKGNRGGRAVPRETVPGETVPAPEIPPAIGTAPASPPITALAAFAAEAAAKLPAEAIAMLATVARMQADMLPKSTWVGSRFATEARKQAESDDPAKQILIHGQATREEADALIEDGIAIMPLLVPVVPPDLQN